MHDAVKGFIGDVTAALLDLGIEDIRIEWSTHDGRLRARVRDHRPHMRATLDMVWLQLQISDNLAGTDFLASSTVAQIADWFAAHERESRATG